SATNASASSAISALRSWRDETTCSSESPAWASSRSTSSRGITPTTSPPAASAASASAPIRPTRPPPYTTPRPRPASAAPKDRAASAYAGERPLEAPQNTQTRCTSLDCPNMQGSIPVAERPRRPEWMKVRAPSQNGSYFDVKKLIHGAHLHTICEEARCPNI